LSEGMGGGFPAEKKETPSLSVWKREYPEDRGPQTIIKGKKEKNIWRPRKGKTPLSEEVSLKKEKDTLGKKGTIKEKSFVLPEKKKGGRQRLVSPGRTPGKKGLAKGKEGKTQGSELRKRKKMAAASEKGEKRKRSQHPARGGNLPGSVCPSHIDR